MDEGTTIFRRVTDRPSRTPVWTLRCMVILHSRSSLNASCFKLEEESAILRLNTSS